MSAPDRQIRTLTPAEVETLVDWAAAEGWNPGLHDAAAFFAADPDGLIGAFVDGELAAGISAVAYGSGFGFIGLYICRPDMRGKGHGKAVWDAGMRRLGARTAGLDGVDAQLANYGGMGFTPAYRTIRFSGRPRMAGPSRDLRPVEPGLFPALADYDRRWFPAPRPAFLQAWLALPCIAFASVREGAVAGYGVARRCRQGWKIGPLFADDQPTAEALLATLAEAAGDEIHIDAPERNAGFIAFLADWGLVPGFATTRMYNGPGGDAFPPPPPWGTTTLELG